jgi:hypothetical protein
MEALVIALRMSSICQRCSNICERPPGVLLVLPYIGQLPGRGYVNQMIKMRPMVIVGNEKYRLSRPRIGKSFGRAA